MKKIITALVAFFAATSMALASDLPSKKAPPAPVAAPASLSGWYVGVNAGALVGSNGYVKDSYSLGALGGYQINKYVAVEGTFDYFGPTAGQDSGQTLIANAVVGYPVAIGGYAVTPYALGGVGLGWGSFGYVGSGKVDGVWNVGGGVKAAITRNWEADLRYRYMNTFQDSRGSNNVITLGANYKF